MKRNTHGMAGGVRWLWAAVAVAAIVAAGSAANAQQRKRVHAQPAPEAKEPAGQGYIGIYMQELTEDLRKGRGIDVADGVLVSGVEDESPAAAAGIEQGDVIVSFDGKTVVSADELRAAVRALEPGREARVGLVRDGASKSVTVTVGGRPEPEVFRFHGGREDFAPLMREFRLLGGPRLGVEAHEIDADELAAYFGAKKGDGLLVLSVEENSVADKAGVKPGDIIREVAGEKIADVDDLRAAIRDYEEGDPFDITVQRQGKPKELKATMDDQGHEYSFSVPEPGAFRWKGTPPPKPWREHRMENELRRDLDRELRRELDDLKQEIKELKEELEERKDG